MFRSDIVSVPISVRPAGWTARPALGRVYRVKSPSAQIPCLSPYPALPWALSVTPLNVES